MLYVVTKLKEISKSDSWVGHLRLLCDHTSINNIAIFNCSSFILLLIFCLVWTNFRSEVFWSIRPKPTHCFCNGTAFAINTQLCRFLCFVWLWRFESVCGLCVFDCESYSFCHANSMGVWVMLQKNFALFANKFFTKFGIKF